MGAVGAPTETVDPAQTAEASAVVSGVVSGVGVLPFPVPAGEGRVAPASGWAWSGAAPELFAQTVRAG